MIPYKPNRLTAVPRTWQVRLEIMKAIRTLVAQDDLEKFDPDQPRVPAGNSDGGRWTNGGDSESSANAGRNIVLAARSKQSEAECEAQYAQDTFICRSVRTPVCWQQAMERYAACLSGRPLPPLNL
jgi:hypothetical protein